MWFFHGKNQIPRTHNWYGWQEITSLCCRVFFVLASYYQVFIQNMHNFHPPTKWTIKKRQTLGLDSGMSEGIWKNKENTDVRLISHILQRGLGNHSSQRRQLVWCRGIHSPQNDWWDIKTNSSCIESLASRGKKLFVNRKTGSWDYIHSLKIPPQYLRSTLHSTNSHYSPSLAQHTANRQQRWGIILLNYDFKMEYLAQRLECSPMARETWVQSQVESYQRHKKMELDTTLLNTQHYKVRFKGKVEQSWEWSSALPYTLV